MEKEVELPEFHELFERSKDDRAMIVGSEVRVVIAAAREALAQIASLTAQVEEKDREIKRVLYREEINIDIANENFARAEKDESDLATRKSEVSDKVSAWHEYLRE